MISILILSIIISAYILTKYQNIVKQHQLAHYVVINNLKKEIDWQKNKTKTIKTTDLNSRLIDLKIEILKKQVNLLREISNQTN